jgi:hypothetical protein
MSDIFNNLRINILGKDLVNDCDEDNKKILDKRFELNSTNLITQNSIKNGLTTKDYINKLNAEITDLYNKRDGLVLSRTANSLNIDVSSYGYFLCNLDKNKSSIMNNMRTSTVLEAILSKYNIFKVGKEIFGDNFYNICKNNGNLPQQELQNIAIRNNIDVKDVIELCQSLKRTPFFYNIPENISKHLFELYVEKETIMIDFEKLFNTNIDLRNEVIKNVKAFIDNEFNGWKTLITGLSQYTTNPIKKLKRKFSELIWGGVNNFTELITYLQTNSEDPELLGMIKNKKPDISSNITILNPSWTFYSAYPTEMSKDDFVKKKYIWLTPEIAQSLLFILGDKKMIQPVIFKFAFKRPLILLNPQKANNTDIKNMFVTSSSYIQQIDKILGKLDSQYNNKILYFIDAINKLINDENYRIDGYRNRRDQNEIAVVELSSVIKESSIVRGIFNKIKVDNNNSIMTFPFTSPGKKLDIKGLDMSTWDTQDSRARCPIKSETNPRAAFYTLYYTWEDEIFSREFKCAGVNNPPEYQYDI